MLSPIFKGGEQAALIKCGFEIRLVFSPFEKGGWREAPGDLFFNEKAARTMRSSLLVEGVILDKYVDYTYN